MFVDSHCHLTYEPLFSNIDDVISHCATNDVNKLLTISTDLQTSKDSILIADKHKNVFCTIGIHPNCSEIEFSNVVPMDRIFCTLFFLQFSITFGMSKINGS